VLEDRVNAEIRRNSAVEIEETDIDTAKAKGAMALFGEKYGDSVRVLTMGGWFLGGAVRRHPCEPHR
jgi:Alanyl-tRNA synthetase